MPTVVHNQQGYFRMALTIHKHVVLLKSFLLISDGKDKRSGKVGYLPEVKPPQ